MGKCKVEVYSRVTGFFRPIQEWNKGKASEFKDRKKFKLDDESGVGGLKTSDITK